MRNKAEITINFRNDNGVDDYKLVVIDFIPNSVRRDFLDINETITQVQLDSIKIQELQIELSQSEDNKEQKRIIKDINELANKIKNVGKSDFFKKRFKLIEKILIKNRVEDSDLLDFEWWDECVEPSEIVDFLNKAVSKDNDTGKKKALTTSKKID